MRLARAILRPVFAFAWRVSGVGVRGLLKLVPPSKDQATATRSLRREVEQKATLCIGRGPAGAEQLWIVNQMRLTEHLLTRDPRAFLTWDVVTRTMFPPPYSAFARIELRFLREHDWPRWRRAIRERISGWPFPCTFYPLSSSNAIHHAYHLSRFEAVAGKQVRDFDQIFEFGGGYGSLCRVARNAGFEGEYTIFDFPEQCALQRYYLHSVGISKTRLISDLDELRKAVRASLGNQSLFIATWSLSESRIELRNELANMIQGFKGFLIAYQNDFSGIDNAVWFRDWRNRFPDVIWTGIDIYHLPGNRYLFGIARE